MIIRIAERYVVEIDMGIFAELISDHRFYFDLLASCHRSSQFEIIGLYRVIVFLIHISAGCVYFVELRFMIIQTWK